MGFFHFIGVLIGGLIVVITKYFWITACYVTSEFYDTLDKEVCHTFENIIIWTGIIIIGLSTLGLIKKIFFKK
jgi:hypothetical protein